MTLNRSNPPQHVAIIMDGNRRWARKKGWNAIKGHQFVVDQVLEPLVDRCIELGIPYLTLWAFSTENWERDKAELTGMMKLFRYGLNKKTDSLFKKGVRIKVLGELERFPADIAKTSREWIAKTKNNNRLTLTFALNYGGRDELVRSFNRFLAAQPGATTVTAEDIAQCLDTVGMPDPDLIIRPGGQLRLSGFLPWQSVYAELYFTETLMPEFGVAEFDRALADFAGRQRRFGR